MAFYIGGQVLISSVGSSGIDIYSDDSGAGKDLDTLLARADIKAVIIAWVSSLPTSAVSTSANGHSQPPNSRPARNH